MKINFYISIFDLKLLLISSPLSFFFPSHKTTIHRNLEKVNTFSASSLYQYPGILDTLYRCSVFIHSKLRRIVPIMFCLWRFVTMHITLLHYKTRPYSNAFLFLFVFQYSFGISPLFLIRSLKICAKMKSEQVNALKLINRWIWCHKIQVYMFKPPMWMMLFHCAMCLSAKWINIIKENPSQDEQLS